MYQIPADTKEKEKVIGGVLTIVQFLWLLGGLGLGLISLIIGYSITKNIFIGIICLLLGAGASLPFAFYKKKDMPLFKYLMLRRKLSKKTVILINERKDAHK